MKRRLAALLGAAQGSVVGGILLLVSAPFMATVAGMIMSAIFGVLYLSVGGSLWWSINRWRWKI